MVELPLINGKVVGSSPTALELRKILMIASSNFFRNLLFCVLCYLIIFHPLELTVWVKCIQFQLEQAFLTLKRYVKNVFKRK
jgi:hypothetical protein